MSAALLQATTLDKSYGPIRVLRGVSLTIAPGESHVVIGPNGAGKTTLFKVLTGELYADRGAVRFGSRDVTRMSAHQRVHLGFGRTTENLPDDTLAQLLQRLSIKPEGMGGDVLGDPRPLYAPGKYGVYLMDPARGRSARTKQELPRLKILRQCGKLLTCSPGTSAEGTKIMVRG